MKNTKKQKAKTYHQGLRLDTPRPVVFKDRRFVERSKQKQNLKKEFQNY